MAEIIKMPRLSDTMTDGVVVKWHKKIGDKIDEGDLLADIETDKATMEFESFQEGFLLHIGVQENETAEVDAVLAILGEKGEDVQSLLASDPVETKNENKPTASNFVEPKPDRQPIEPINKVAEKTIEHIPIVTASSGRIKISPLAKRIAKEKKIDITNINGFIYNL